MAAEEKVRRIHRLAPCPGYDVERLESWLTDMAKDGWHLEADSFAGFLPFVQGPPRNIRYRLEPRKDMDSVTPDSEARDLAEKYGWEFVAAYGNFYIYRTTRPDAREMNTDPAVQAMALKSVRRSFTLQLALQTVITGDMLFRVFREPFRYMVTFSALYPLAVLIFILAVIIYDIRRIIHIRKLRKQLKENIPLDHNKPWKKTASLHRWVKIFLAAVYVLVIGLAITRCTIAFSDGEKPTADYPGDPPFVTFQDLSPAGEFTGKNFMDRYNEYRRMSTSAAPVILEWMEFGDLTTPEGDTVSGSLSITYYETISPWLAEGLFNDFLRNARKEDNYSEHVMPELDVDRIVGYYLYGDMVLVQHGNIFIEARVNLLDQNDESLTEKWAALMADMLT